MADRTRAWQGIHMEVRVPLGARSLDAALVTERPSVAVVGPSGSGKTTLIRILAGVARRATGTLVVDGATWMDPSGVRVPPWERRVGWCPQDVLLFPHLSVRENMAYAGAAGADVESAADLFHITDLLDRRPRNLSGGERQRVAVARALLSQPELLLLDEPFSALDRPLRQQLSRTLRDLLDERAIPLVLVSHDEQDAEILAEERWHLAEGVLTRL
jgi:molybdate transport system ATP-binding protein